MKSKRVVIALGSPRKNGNSAALAGEVAKGAQAGGAEVDIFNLHEMNIKPCSACDECRKASNTDCIINDDMKSLYPKLRQSDALVFATPIYWFTVTAQTKLFMDRLYALGGPQGHALKGKKIGIVLTYGDSDPFNSGAVNAIRTFQDAFAYVGLPIVDIVYGSADAAGEIKQNSGLMKKAFALGEKLAG